MTAFLQSQNLWCYVMDPKKNTFANCMQQVGNLEATIEGLKRDRPKDVETLQKSIELHQGFQAFHARSKESCEHAEKVIAARRDYVGDWHVEPLRTYPSSNYDTWAKDLKCYLRLSHVWYVIVEPDEENCAGSYETPYTNLRDRDDATARYIISTALKPDQMWLIMKETTAKKAWMRISERYATA